MRSPSRPASHAFITSPSLSNCCISRQICFNTSWAVAEFAYFLLFTSFMGVSMKLLGRNGIWAKSHFSQFGLCSFGCANVRRCPRAHVTTHELPSLNRPEICSLSGEAFCSKASAIVRPNDGFSDMISIFINC